MEAWGELVEVNDDHQLPRVMDILGVRKAVNDHRKRETEQNDRVVHPSIARRARNAFRARKRLAIALSAPPAEQLTRVSVRVFRATFHLPGVVRQMSLDIPVSNANARTGTRKGLSMGVEMVHHVICAVFERAATAVPVWTS